LIKLIDRPVGYQPVAFLFVLMREGAPVYQAMISERCGDQFLGREGATTGSRANHVKFLILLTAPIPAMINFTGGIGGVAAMFLEVLGEGHGVFEFGHIPNPGSEPVNTGGPRAQAGHEARARGITQGRLTMCIRKRRPTLGQSINVRSLNHRMTSQISNPVILIVNGDHQDIGFLVRRREA
jgi:hypothetical protein